MLSPIHFSGTHIVAFNAKRLDRQYDRDELKRLVHQTMSMVSKEWGSFITHAGIERYSVSLPLKNIKEPTLTFRNAHDKLSLRVVIPPSAKPNTPARKLIPIKLITSGKTEWVQQVDTVLQHLLNRFQKNAARSPLRFTYHFEPEQ